MLDSSGCRSLRTSRSSSPAGSCSSGGSRAVPRTTWRRAAAGRWGEPRTGHGEHHNVSVLSVECACLLQPFEAKYLRSTRSKRIYFSTNQRPRPVESRIAQIGAKMQSLGWLLSGYTDDCSSIQTASRTISILWSPSSACT